MRQTKTRRLQTLEYDQENLDTLLGHNAEKRSRWSGLTGACAQFM